MIDMGMRQQNIINFRRADRKIMVFVNVRPLFHTVIHQNAFAAGFKKMAASGHFVIRPDKGYFIAVSISAHELRNKL